MSERAICASGDLVDGGPGVRFSVGRDAETQEAFVVRWRGRAHAFLNRCGHVPVELDWQSGRFFDHSGVYLVCATHGALYAPDTGRCLGGRCNGRGLTAVPVTEHDGQVFATEEG